jgi:hypothetical protein
MRVDFDGLVTKRRQKHPYSSPLLSTLGLASPDNKVDCESAAGHQRLVVLFLVNRGHRTWGAQRGILEKEVMMRIEGNEGGRKGLYSRNGR